MGALGPSKTIVSCVQISLCPPISKRSTKCHNHTFQKGADLKKSCLQHILETTRKHDGYQCRKGEKIGAQGVPGITFWLILSPFLLILRNNLSRCARLSYRYPGYIFCHALSFFALSSPPCNKHNTDFNIYFHCSLALCTKAPSAAVWAKPTWITGIVEYLWESMKIDQIHRAQGKSTKSRGSQ